MKEIEKIDKYLDLARELKKATNYDIWTEFFCPSGLQRKKTKKTEEIEKLYKYLDLARELKKQWNGKMIVIPIVESKL